MTTYFVSNTGSDSNAGTSTGAPWQTIAGSVNLTGGTKPALNGGDSVLFNGGQTFTGAIVMGTTNFGTSPAPSALHPVTFGSYGTGQGIISSTTSNGFAGTNVGGIIINNLTFTGNGVAGADIKGILIVNTLGTATYLDYLQINNCIISNYGVMGIELDSNSSDRGYTNVTISGCTIHDCGGFNSNRVNSGIITGTSDASATAASFINFLIINCTIYNITGSATTATASGFGMFVGMITNLLITNCVVHDCGTGATSGGGGPAGIQYFNCVNPIIQFCEVYNMSDGGTNIDGDGYNPSSSTGGIVQYCYSHDNNGGGVGADNAFSLASSDVTIRYCISVNDGNNPSNTVSRCAFGATINASFAMTANIYNNTAYNNNGAPALILAGVSGPESDLGGRVNNNIFYTTTGQTISSASANSVILDGNNYFRSSGFSLVWAGTTYTSFATFKSSNVTQETINGGFATDPLLANPGPTAIVASGHNVSATLGYLLKSNSTMVNTGINLLTHFAINPGSQDFNGVYVPRLGNTGFNVGAADTTIGVATLMGGECL